MSASTETQFQVLCIPRAMLFHTAEIVENAFNQAMHGKFVKSVNQTTTTDKAGLQFNVFFIHPDQDFKANRNTDTLYKKLTEEGIINISTGTGKFFWKVKLYVPHLKSQYLPKVEDPVVRPVQVGPRIMSDSEVAEFREWQREKAEAKAIADKEAAEKAAAHAQWQALGERLYPLVTAFLNKEFPNYKHPGKITGMLLDMPREDIESMMINLDEFAGYVREAVRVYREHILREAGAA